MKNLILIFIILLSLFGLEIYSQCDLNSIIFKLNSNDRALRIEAINDVRDCNESSAIPYLEDRLHIENDYHIALRLLWALDALNAENIVSDALDLFSYFEEGKFSKEVSYVNKLLVLDILFRRGNFSKGYILFDFWERYPNSYDLMTLRLLEMLIQNDSTVNQNGAAILEEAFELNIGIENKVRIMKILSRNHGPKVTDFFLNLVFNDPEILIRSTAINCLVENNYPGNPELLINRLYDDSSENIRKRVAKILLFQWGTPSTYKVVSSSSLMSHNSNIKDILQYYLKFFKPKDVDVSVDVRIDSLNNNLEELTLYNWLGDLQFKNELQSILESAKTHLLSGDSLACRVQVKSFQDTVDNVYKDSLNADPRFVTIEGWKFLYWNAQYILDRLPEPQTTPNLLVNLKNSLGNQIPASNVMYYEGSWKDAVNNGDGTFTVITTKPNVSIRMFYEYANQTVNNVPAQNNTYTFTTVNAAVQLKNSSGNLMDEGTVQYYAGAWRSFGTTINGVAYKELLPVNYSFRMTYEGGNQDKQQNLSDNQTVVFQTVNAAVQLKNSSGNLMDEGTVQYYAGAWRSFGTTVNGVAYKELLPVNYSFRMTYEYVSNDKQQNLSENPVVDFNTVLCTIKVTNANSQPLEGANTKYYSVAWRDIGLTDSNGEITKELLPKNLSFRATYNNVSRDKQQDISVNNLVEIMLNIP